MFLFRLALAMGRPVRELLRTIDSREITEWMAFDQIQPFGDDRADLRSAIVAMTLANVNRPKKSSKVWTPRDFMPFLSKTEPRKVLADRIRKALKHRVVTDG